MKLSRALALAKKDWKRILREPAFLFMIILFPAMLTLAFGTSFGAVGGSQPLVYNVGVVELGDANSTASDLFTSGMQATGVVNVNHFQDNESAQAALSQGKVQGVVVLPSSFDASAQRFRAYPAEPAMWVNSTVSLYLDKASMLSAQVIPSIVDQVIGQGVLAANTTTPASPITVTNPAFVSVRSSSMFEAFAPGLFAFASIYMIMMVASTYTSDRESGMLGRIATTPSTGSDVVMGSVLSYVGIGLVQALLVFACAYALGYHPVAGLLGLSMGFLIVTVFALCNIGFGLIAATIAKSGGGATGISFVFLMPQLFLGTFVGTTLSATAQAAGRFVPAYYVTDALTSLFTRGAAATSQAVLTDLVVVAASGVAVLLIGVQVFKRFGRT